MAQVALEGTKDPQVRFLALELTGNLRQKDYYAEACALHKYVRDNVRYVRDIQTVEVLQTPETTLKLRAGDCDDKSILLSALLGSIGHSARFIAVSFRPGQYSHVWVQDLIQGQWIDLETTEPVDCGTRIPDDGAVGYLLKEVR